MLSTCMSATSRSRRFGKPRRRSPPSALRSPCRSHPGALLARSSSRSRVSAASSEQASDQRPASLGVEVGLDRRGRLHPFVAVGLDPVGLDAVVAAPDGRHAGRNRLAAFVGKRSRVGGCDALRRRRRLLLSTASHRLLRGADALPSASSDGLCFDPRRRARRQSSGVAPGRVVLVPATARREQERGARRHPSAASRLSAAPCNRRSGSSRPSGRRRRRSWCGPA